MSENKPLCTNNATTEEAHAGAKYTDEMPHLLRVSAQKDYIPRICAVHDLCGYGKCSLGVAIPVLSAAGLDVCPLPTSLFSAHTRFDYFYMHDTTSMLEPYLDAWEKEDVEIDAIYSGFLGSPEQTAAIERLKTMFPEAFVVVDPVMGDAGVRYATYTDELCARMCELAHGADVLTPNLTEAAILTGRSYCGESPDRAELDSLIEGLRQYHARYLILKGIETADGCIENYIVTNGSNVEVVRHKKHDFSLHGTGDLFASCVLAAFIRLGDMKKAVEFASDFVYQAMLLSQKQPAWQLRGISFEPLLGELCSLK